jgi:hypothetical protein
MSALSSSYHIGQGVGLAIPRTPQDLVTIKKYSVTGHEAIRPLGPQMRALGLAELFSSFEPRLYIPFGKFR